jgi:type IV secretion system protein VirB1
MRQDAMSPKTSLNISDLDTPGAVIEMSEEEAETFGAFVETAVSQEDADEANADITGEMADVK